MTNDKFTLADVRRQAYKATDAWWTVLLVDPIASRLLVPLANHTKITPNQLSLAAFIFGLCAAYSFYVGSTTALIVGALLYHISFMLDCMDGKIARLKGTGTVFGMWVDYTLDRVRVIICAIALMAGQVQQTGNHTYLYLAFIIIAMDTVRYMNALHLYKMRRVMNRKIRAAKKKLLKCGQGEDGALEADRSRYSASAGETAAKIDQTATAESAENDRNRGITGGKGNAGNIGNMGDIGNTVGDTGRTGSTENAVDNGNTGDAGVTGDIGGPQGEPPHERKPDFQRGFKSRFKRYLKVRDWLERHRIRSHLFSGIEFQMFIFIIAPIIGWIPEIVVLSAIALFSFELAIIYKLWLSTKDFKRELSEIQEATASRTTTSLS